MKHPEFLRKIFFVAGSLMLCSVIHATAQRTKTQHTLTADEAKAVKKDAATLFNTENYNGALKGYLELIKTDPNNAEINFRLGYCYLMTNGNRAKALEYFDAAAKSKNPRKESMYFFGLAYMYAERWDDAINAFEVYKGGTHSKPVKDFPDAERQEEMCETAKELTAHPLKVTFENLGKGINSSYDDYNPFVSADGKTLVFSSRRKGNMGGFIEDLGMYSADVFWTNWKDTTWSKAKSVGAALNSEWDEESVNLSADGNTIIAYFDNSEGTGDLAYATLKGKTWQKSTLFSPVINSKEIESAGSISLDGSTLYFASERKDSKGKSDLYMSKRKENGDWGTPANLGAAINTKYDEDAPFISMDGKTLYFSSKGHNSMGGYDVFRSVYDESSGSWSEPVNIGYPVNNADDNLFFSMTGDQRTAYVAAWREGGWGDRDIYRITYQDTTDHPFLSLISGTVASETNAKVEVTKATLTSKSDPSVSMTYKPFSPGNEFVLSAKPGSYELSVEGYNFSPYKEEITISNEFPPVNITKKITVKTGKQ
ncbi:MAG: hypothetical protein NT126_12750 [Bacteroidetes bacterium]|nr:hypothetical protein [Bacteroidota bacterium]